MKASADSPRVVVVGAGMLGLATVRALADAPVSVQLVDIHNYTTFPPLLFQVATCFISPQEVARPIRAIVRRHARTTFRLGEVVDVDCAERVVRLDGGDVVPFDYLVLAAGVVPAFGHVPGAAQHAIRSSPSPTATGSATGCSDPSSRPRLTRHGRRWRIRAW